MLKDIINHQVLMQTHWSPAFSHAQTFSCMSQQFSLSQTNVTFGVWLLTPERILTNIILSVFYAEVHYQIKNS